MRTRRRRGASAGVLAAAVAAVAAPYNPSEAQVRRAAMPVTATVPAAPCGTAGADPACTVVVRTVRIADGPASAASAPASTWITGTSVDSPAGATGGRLLIVVTHVY
jgi:hypothetical protein